MPTYDMRCNECGYEAERRYATFKQSTRARCPDCESPLVKKMSSFHCSINTGASEDKSGNLVLGIQLPCKDHAVVTDGESVYLIKLPENIVKETEKERKSGEINLN